MPELPEVETVRRGLSGYLTGQRLAGVTVRRRDLRLPIPKDFEKKLKGRVVKEISRRAKYLLFYLDDGGVVIGHLGMSGRMFVKDAPRYKPETHDHVLMKTESGLTLVYSDPRRFGVLTLGTASALDKHALISVLGPEPLASDFDAAKLYAGLFSRLRSPLKAALLDQHVVAGLGNIYVSEALHRAALSPLRASGTVTMKEAARLVTAIRDVLNEALLSGGSTLRDYVQADGALGGFQNRFRVYDRYQSSCPRRGCFGVVERIVQAGRSTYFCPQCQK